MTAPKDDKALQWGKLILPVILPLLVGSEIWQYYEAPNKIKADTEEHVNNIALYKLERKVDSLADVLIKKEYAKGLLLNATAEVKGLNGAAAKEYLGKVFNVADEAIKNDSNWRHVQRPFIVYLMANQKKLEHLFKYNYLVPMQNLETNKLEFNYIDGIYPIKENNVNGGVIRYWRDNTDDQHPLQSISKIKDN